MTLEILRGLLVLGLPFAIVGFIAWKVIASGSKVESYTGSLRMLGNANWSPNGKVLTYSTIEIGDHLLSGLRIDGSLDNFLDRAVKMNGDATLYVAGSQMWRIVGLGKYIVGVRLPDGRLYYSRMSNMVVMAGIALGIVLIPFLIGLLLLPIMVLVWRINVAASSLAALGGMPVQVKTGGD